jgi:hypothetical protein
VRANVYVDGFSLYYAALKGTPYSGSTSASCRGTCSLATGSTASATSPPGKRRRYDVELMKAASFYKPIRQGVLAASQFPPQLTDAHGTITKPSGW